MMVEITEKLRAWLSQRSSTPPISVRVSVRVKVRVRVRVRVSMVTARFKHSSLDPTSR